MKSNKTFSSNFCKVALAKLLKSLSVMSNFKEIFQEFRKNTSCKKILLVVLFLKLTSQAGMSVVGQWFLLSYDCNRSPTSSETPGSNYWSPIKGKLRSQQNLLPAIVSLICSRGTKNLGTCLQMMLEKVIQLVYQKKYISESCTISWNVLQRTHAFLGRCIFMLGFTHHLIHLPWQGTRSGLNTEDQILQ